MYVLSGSCISIFAKFELYRRSGRSKRAPKIYLGTYNHYTWKARHDQYARSVSVPSEIQGKASVVCSSLPITVAQSCARIFRFFRRLCTIRTIQNIPDYAISCFIEGESHTTRNVADGRSHQLPNQEASRRSRALPSCFTQHKDVMRACTYFLKS